MADNKSTPPERDNKDSDQKQGQPGSNPAPKRTYSSRGDFDQSYQDSKGRGSYPEEQDEKASSPANKANDSNTTKK